MGLIASYLSLTRNKFTNKRPPHLLMENVADGWTATSTSPRVSGSLELHGMFEGIGPTVRRLLALLNGPHFTKIVLAHIDKGDFKSTSLVSGCSETLELSDIIDYLPRAVPKFSSSA